MTVIAGITGETIKATTFTITWNNVGSLCSSVQPFTEKPRSSLVEFWIWRVFFMKNAYVQYLSFSLTFLFAGNEDEEADNEMRRFAVLSYIDLLEKPVLPDILVWIICWVSLITRLHLCCMLLSCSLRLVVFSHKWRTLSTEKAEYKKVSATDSRLVLDWYLFFKIFLSWAIFEVRFFSSEEMVESVFRSNAQRSNAERYV